MNTKQIHTEYNKILLSCIFMYFHVFVLYLVCIFSYFLYLQSRSKTSGHWWWRAPDCSCIHCWAVSVVTYLFVFFLYSLVFVMYLSRRCATKYTKNTLQIHARYERIQKNTGIPFSLYSNVSAEKYKKIQCNFEGKCDIFEGKCAKTRMGRGAYLRSSMYQVA